MPTTLIKINKHIDGHKPGDEVKIECDEIGIPLSRSWRRRLKDAEFDQCCEIVEPKGILDVAEPEKPAKKSKPNSKVKSQETE